MQPNYLAMHTWNAIGDGRRFIDLPDDYQGRLLEVAKEVLKGQGSGIVGLEDFEAKANEIFSNSPKSVKVGEIQFAKVIAKAAGMAHVPHIATSILQVPAFAQSVYRAATKSLHTDKGGNKDAFQELEEAMRVVRKAHERKQ
jgi:hypothetical protein